MYCYQTILRICRRIGFIALTRRFIATIALALVFPVLANAYTLVLRDGRRIEIPDKFKVTETALTYEVTPGILVTLQVKSIDVKATDTANGSPQGTLLGRIGQEFIAQPATAGRISARRAARTLTNIDLEQTRLKRIESEEAYEIRRKELGLPSREESDRRRQAESVRARELLAQSEIDRAEAERYWRTRATDLRNEILVLDSEIDFLRTRVMETGGSFSMGSFVTFGVPGPFVASRGPQLTPHGVASQNPSGIRQSVAQSVATVGVQPRRQVSSSSYGFQNQTRRFNSCLYGPCGQVYPVTYPFNYDSYDRTALILRLQELEASRVGLEARWQQLEDEARRAGAQPGWLRY